MKNIFPDVLYYPFEIEDSKFKSIIIDEFEAALDIYEALCNSGYNAEIYTQVDADAEHPNDRIYERGFRLVNRTGVYMIFWK